MAHNQPTGYQQPMFQPEAGYGQPQPGYGQPQMPYGNPQPGYQPHPGQPHPYAQPIGGQPQIAYANPQPGFQPHQVNAQPANHGQPQPNAQPTETNKKFRGFERLETNDGIFVKQKMSLAEVITGCELENIYYVHSMNKDGKKMGKKLFKAKEKSGFCARQCMSGECRPFKLKINTFDDSNELDNEPFLLMDRPCKCTFLCCNRPEIKVRYFIDGMSEYLGKIRDRWDCCNVMLDVHDKNGDIKYVIDGSCCQLGFHCRCPCNSCETIGFDIKSPSGSIVASLIKKSPGCIKATVSDADNFSLFFPNGATKEDKALLMAAVLFLDFRYFEEKK